MNFISKNEELKFESSNRKGQGPALTENYIFHAGLHVTRCQSQMLFSHHEDEGRGLGGGKLNSEPCENYPRFRKGLDFHASAKFETKSIIY